MVSWQTLSLVREQIVTGFEAEMKGRKEPLAEEEGEQMEAICRCALRSGAGIPASTLSGR
jgi:hypothetical protein